MTEQAELFARDEFLLPREHHPLECTVYAYARAKSEHRLGGRYGRFGCTIVRIEFVDGGFAEYPKWFKGPAKAKGESAIFFGSAGAVFVKCDLADPDPNLDAETMEAWRDYVAAKDAR